MKDAENIAKVDADDNKLESLVKQAKSTDMVLQKTDQVKTNSLERPNSLQKRQPKLKENGTSFIQNRDSIHWDAETSSDEDSSPDYQDVEKEFFVDVTEAPLSAFTLVNPQKQINGNGTNFHQTAPQTPTGKVFKVPPASSSQSQECDTKSKELQEQCQKLQELQRNYRLTPSSQIIAPSNTPTSPSIQPVKGALNNSFSTPTSSRVPYNGSSVVKKPLIAPKPQVLSERIETRNANNNASATQESSSRLNNNIDPKSTTV